MRSLWAIVFIATILALATSGEADPRWGGHWHGHWGGGDAGSSFWGGALGGFLGSMIQPPPVVVQPPVVVAPPVVIQPSVPELQPWTAPWYQTCANKYRTFDARSGNYTGFDGQPHFCNG